MNTNMLCLSVAIPMPNIGETVKTVTLKSFSHGFTIVLKSQSPLLGFKPDKTICYEGNRIASPFNIRALLLLE